MTECAILIGCGLAGLAGAITLALLPVALVLNFVLVPAYGATGAALASVSANALGALAAGLAVSRRVAPIMSLGMLARAVIATILVTAGAAVLRVEGLLLVVEMAVLLIAYTGIVVALRLVGREDVKLFLPARTSRPPDVTELQEIDGDLP